MDTLEALDDAVYDAIAGKQGAIDDVLGLWPQVRERLESEMVDESREQYLRYTMSVWEDFLQDSTDPAKAVAALDVMCVLFED